MPSKASENDNVHHPKYPLPFQSSLMPDINQLTVFQTVRLLHVRVCLCGYLDSTSDGITKRNHSHIHHTTPDADGSARTKQGSKGAGVVERGIFLVRDWAFHGDV